MTDEQMDARLHAAGRRWRAALAISDVPVDPGADDLVVTPPSPPRRRQRWVAVASAAVLAAALVIAVTVVATRGVRQHAGTLSADSASLVGTTWKLPGAPASIRIDGSTIRITNGCPGQTNHVRVGSATFTVGRLIRPGSACAARNITAAQSMQLDRFTRVLDGTVSWSVSGTTLTLSRAGVGLVELTSTGLPPGQPALVGVRWTLRTIHTPALPQLRARAGWLEVQRTGRMDWGDGCNGFGAAVTVRSASLVIADATSTQVACGRNPVARAMAAVLHATVTYRIVGNQLTITKDGQGRLVFVDARTMSPRTQALLSHSWKLTGTQRSYSNGSSGAGSGSSAVGLSTVTFARDGSFTVQHRCYTDTGTVAIGASTLALTKVRLLRAIPCASNAETLDGQKQNDFVDKLLAGTVRWQVAGAQLTITKGNDSATFRAVPRPR